ncbi:hypothetical protein [uncultured Parabacteroides sp.]|uniref:hypothetical protein n=1 Tax=Parabacteroides sp. ASD2025 TaxID=3415987 RepID=UPI0025DD2011|nr:hypothetical protein [uncultured Parabacteroides sp.]
MKRILFILVSLYAGALAVQAAGTPHLLPWPQKVVWSGEKAVDGLVYSPDKKR